eukprot:7381709-Prymnesium_polylepis.1
MPTDERTRGSHQPTRLQRCADLESRASRGRDRSGTRCAGAKPSAVSPRDNLAHRSVVVEGTRERSLSVCLWQKVRPERISAR